MNPLDAFLWILVISFAVFMLMAIGAAALALWMAVRFKPWLPDHEQPQPWRRPTYLPKAKRNGHGKWPTPTDK